MGGVGFGGVGSLWFIRGGQGVRFTSGGQSGRQGGCEDMCGGAVAVVVEWLGLLLWTPYYYTYSGHLQCDRAACVAAKNIREDCA